MSNQSTVLDMISALATDNPALSTALQLLTADVYKAYYAQFPPTAVSVFGATGQVPTVANVTGFIAQLFSNNLRLNWDAISGINSYEIRYHSGIATDWNAAVKVVTTSTQNADVNPIAIPLVYGNHTFFIKAIDNSGIYSTLATTVVVNIPVIAAPIVSPTVIDNNVLLKWTIPVTTFQLDHYNVYRSGVFIGNMNGTFEAIFETTSGTFTYAVEAVDIVGNVGTQGTVVASVNQPPDYELQDSRVSALGGTCVNVFHDTVLAALLCDFDTTKTWTTHFTSNSWTSPQDQITAGFPYYLEPTLLTGSYEEVIDYGVEIDNLILSLRWSINNLDGTVTVASKVAFSLDNITYGSFINGSSVFSTAMRYAKIHIDFTGADTHSLAIFSNLQILLDVKREVDSGTVSALSTDATGTQVNFNKSFKSIDSITLTVGSTEPVTAIYDFVSIPNPTGFKVYIFDSSGNRASYTVSWKARGIV